MSGIIFFTLVSLHLLVGPFLPVGTLRRTFFSVNLCEDPYFVVSNLIPAVEALLTRVLKVRPHGNTQIPGM